MEGTATQSRSRARPPARQSPPSGSVAAALTAPGYAGWLLIGVFAAIAYAAFADGAAAVPEESHVQLALAAAVLLAGIGVAVGELGAARAPLAWAGTGSIAGFALYCALSVQWSLAPDLSWVAANRAAEYAALVVVVLLAAPSVRAAPAKALAALITLALAVSLYALGGKLFPELSVGPINLDHASQFARLRAPLGYWNALGVLLSMAAPACLWVAAQPARRPSLRIGALVGLELMLVTIALTYSRGALLALAAAALVIVAFGEQRLRAAAAALLALAAAAAPVAYAFSRDALSRDGVAAADRAGDGAQLALILAVSMIALVGVAVILLRNEPELRFSRRRRAGLRRLGALVAAVVAIAAVGALASTERGLGGSVSHEWQQFRRPVGIGNDPGRLLSSNGSNRWIWWREAAGAFSDRPVAGWGAGSFPIIHDRYREYQTQVRSAHNVPLQFLAEGGVIGALLALGGVGLLFAAAIRTTRAKPSERGARVALLAAGAAWGVHCLVDWDWEIPAVTLTALAALAIAAAPWREGRRWLDPHPPADRRRRLNESLSVPVGIAAAVIAIAIAVSAELPALAEHRRLDALTRAAAADPGDRGALEAAAEEAASAHDLNPLDEDALFAAASLQQRLGNPGEAQSLLQQAARGHPDDYRVWDRLLTFATETGNPELARTAFERRLAADPLSFAAGGDTGAGAAFVLEVPPELSPTAYGTPPER
jgi:tetratricopeptide (TPR) repeat protein